VYPIRLIVVGKPKSESILQLENHYKKLIKTYVRFEILEIKEGKGSGERQLLDEAERVRNALKGFQRQILLDAGGVQRNSESFASWLGSRVDLGERLAFAIGSSYGLHPSLKADIKEHISLSSMTFPHDLSRIMFLEQLYRAFCILNEKPYHK
jgi:23S rRNA (pseudouridine1915-N3)-methyltransferase